MTSDDDKEITECINMVLSASGLGLVHESINVNMIQDYTRSWFACKLRIPSYPLEFTNPKQGQIVFSLRQY
jgi:hypothetical protein